MATKRTIKYSEPADYFPESIRKKHKIGEYAEKNTETKKTVTKETKETKKTK